MTDISYEILTGKLTPLAHEAFRAAFWQAKEAGNRNVELSHWLFQLVSAEGSDIAATLDHLGVAAGQVLTELTEAIGRGKRNVTEFPSIAGPLGESLDRGWLYASLLFGSAALRSGHVLLGALRDEELRKVLAAASRSLARLDPDAVADSARAVWGASTEEGQPPVAGSQLPQAAAAGGRKGAAPMDAAASPLARFATDLTAQAAARWTQWSVATTRSVRSSTSSCGGARTTRC